MMKNVRFFLAAALFALVTMGLAADDGITSSTAFSLQISTRPEAKLGVTQSFTFPFLVGEGPLTSGNNIKASLSAEATPVSLTGIGQVVWTPIAFFELSGGGKIGSGWNMPLGNGIGLNVPVGSGTSRKSEIQGGAFDGAQWSAWAGGAVQFDLAAVLPGDWNHVLFRTYDEIRYSVYTRAEPNDAWIIENDDAENQNGWLWYGSVVLGYQMPLSPVLNFVALMAEVDLNLYDVPGKETWGGNLGRWTLSSILNFALTPNLSTQFIMQMRTRRNYGHSDYENRNDLWYQDQVIDGSGGNQRLVFYRAALVFSYTL